ncbi:hypothetical protein RRV45_11605 [Bacillus sp. DTU_2020_1000418_1_SI_GHA_SEK_038]|uniref:hypothetical protein n=1 Tax=Bacillus sp. DTU_2020_1000418_1_SI_GHA_SEK_038 TaxID=3077585 RepID=UPI0028E6BBFC|nr:hypothetical protein [Bacillus sp. DTU_2020_1000418_1_SI_GHA_SEK_038]WNS73569.1 hypothetical protein RRV45_11605 [Bacillus sp. DTU_2020_1000418_1_SI_GHA_SEK_038]
MFSFESDALLVEDREDLIAVLQMRFGFIPGEVIEKIYEINEMSSLQRLILAAANSASWEVFLRELEAGEEAVRILGEDFNPIGSYLLGRDDHYGAKAE